MTERFVDTALLRVISRRNLLKGLTGLGLSAVTVSCFGTSSKSEDISSIASETLRFSLADETRPIDLDGFEQNLLANTNQQRIYRGLNPLALEAILVEVARLRSWDMAKRDYFGHEFTGGTVFTILAQINYPFMNSGENIAKNNYPDKDCEKAAFDGLMDSEGHKSIILDENYTKIGIGHYRRSDGMHYFTQLFASRIV